MSDPTDERVELDAIVAQYRAELARLNYVRGSINVYLRSIRRLFRLMEEQGVALGDLTPDVAADLVRRAQWRCDRQQYAVFIVKRFVEYLAAQGIARPPAPPTAAAMARAALRRDYEDYLLRQRGLSDRTIASCWYVADRFLTFRFGDNDVDFGRIVPGDIVAFLQRLTGRKTPYRDKTQPTHLRNFFQYLFKEGLTATNLALCIPKVAQRYAARLPRHLAPEEVESVLASVRSDPRFGRRNHAMILLLARLGLRAPEVIAIQLDDIDWRAGELVVRGKGQRHDRVPIPPDVGEALADYIRHDRVSASRALFVSTRAPRGPFKDGQMLNAILKDAFARCGVKPPCPYVGSHVLRHSLATNLVRNGASLDEVRDVLRHRSRASTLIYAKVDIEGLRSIAQTWPSTGGAQ
ncbi:MAG TPA: tyrosine-type recombinase/integrase [Acetobacteraceae bacterium]|nr:tyrosine-type recombinase/integrase [Acetobacteraceae bacterium]